MLQSVIIYRFGPVAEFIFNDYVAHCDVGSILTVLLVNVPIHESFNQFVMKNVQDYRTFFSVNLGLGEELLTHYFSLDYRNNCEQKNSICLNNVVYPRILLFSYYFLPKNFISLFLDQTIFRTQILFSRISIDFYLKVIQYLGR